MRSILLVALVVLNVALLAALWATPARAQFDAAESPYVMFTGRWQGGSDAVYVLHLDRRELMGWRFDQASRRLVPLRRRPLAPDFVTGGRP